MRRLDYLESLGVDAIWIGPFQTSPNKDNGYDIANFYSVDKRYGSNGARRRRRHAPRGARVVRLPMVPRGRTRICAARATRQRRGREVVARARGRGHRRANAPVLSRYADLSPITDAGPASAARGSKLRLCRAIRSRFANAWLR